MEGISGPNPKKRHEMHTASAAALMDTYRAVQAETGSIVPPRADFTPTRCKLFISNMVLLQRGAEDKFNFRLCGTGVVNRTGLEVTGTEFGAMLTPQERNIRLLHLRALLHARCGATSLTSEIYDGEAVAVEYLSLPLADAGAKVSMLINVSAPLDPTDMAAITTSTEKFGDIEAMRLIDIGAGTDAYHAFWNETLSGLHVDRADRGGGAP